MAKPKKFPDIVALSKALAVDWVKIDGTPPDPPDPLETCDFCGADIFDTDDHWDGSWETTRGDSGNYIACKNCVKKAGVEW